MSGQGSSTKYIETTTLGTFGWVGVVFLLAIVSVLFLSALGPVGGR